MVDRRLILRLMGAVLLAVVYPEITWAAANPAPIIVEIERQLDLPDAKYKLIDDKVNQNKEAAPGHWIKLRGVVRKASDNSDISAQVTAWKWEINGRVVLNYIQKKNEKGIDTAVVLPLKDFSQREINYYYISGTGPQAIKLTATIGDKAYEKSDSITVKPPETVSLETVTTTDSPNTNGVGVGLLQFRKKPGIRLHYGISAKNPGIKWIGTATMPKVNCPGKLAGGGGTAITQVVNTLRSFTVKGQESFITSEGAEVLDTDVQYDNKIVPGDPGWKVVHDVANDTPNNRLVDEAGVTASGAADAFRSFFMYKPFGDNSIWVSLSVVKWHWKGHTVFENNQWQPPTGTESDVNPKGTETDEQPQWSQNLTDLKPMVRAE